MHGSAVGHSQRRSDMCTRKEEMGGPGVDDYNQACTGVTERSLHMHMHVRLAIASTSMRWDSEHWQA